MSDLAPAPPPADEDPICELIVDGESFEIRVSNGNFDHRWISGPGVGPTGFATRKSDASAPTLQEHVDAVREFLQAARRDIAEGGRPES